MAVKVCVPNFCRLMFVPVVWKALVKTNVSVTPLGKTMLWTYVCPAPKHGALHMFRPVSPQVTAKPSPLAAVPLMVSLKVKVTIDGVCACAAGANTAPTAATSAHTPPTPMMRFIVVNPADRSLREVPGGRRPCNGVSVALVSK